MFALPTTIFYIQRKTNSVGPQTALTHQQRALQDFQLSLLCIC